MRIQPRCSASIDGTVSSTTATVERAKPSNITRARSLVERNEEQINQISDQFVNGLGDIEKNVHNQFATGSKDVSKNVAKMSTDMSGNLARVSTEITKSLKTIEKDVKDGSDRLIEEWNKVLIETHKRVDGKYDEAIAAKEKVLDKQVAEAQSQITSKLNTAISKNGEPLNELNTKMDEAAKEAAEQYDAPWYKSKFARWLWSALKSFLIGLGKFLLIAAIAFGALVLIVIGVILLIGGAIGWGIALIVAGLVILVAIIAYMIYGFVMNIVNRIRSADNWWEGIWAFFVGILDFVGIPRIIEGIIHHDIVNWHKLTEEEAGARFGQGVLDLILSLTIILRLIKYLRGPEAPPLPERDFGQRRWWRRQRCHSRGKRYRRQRCRSWWR